MKKKFFLLLFLIPTITSAQNEAAEDTIPGPLITETGKPAGIKKEIKATKDGDILRSADGMVELIIPPGAVSKKTDISIQPITNLMTNGNGKAYRLEPSGIRFQKPVQLIFHYNEEEIKDNMQLLLGIAMQDEKGQWLSLNNFDLDTVAKTISGHINHFSDWSNFSAIKLYPSYTRLKVKKEINLTIDLISNEDDLSPLSTDPMFSAIKKRNIPWTSAWKATAGIIQKQSKTFATFTAPVSVPNQNPVAVTADLNGLTYTTKVRGQAITFKDLKLVSNILVYDDAYEVTMISEMQDPGAGSSLGAVTYKDTGSFVVSLNGNEARIIERVNKNTTASLDYSGGCCYNYKIIKPGTGNIHIAGRPVIKVTSPSVQGKGAWIEIAFPRFPCITPIFQVTCQCPNDKAPTIFTNEKGIVMLAKFLAAQPEIVKFEAKEGEQIILEHGNPGAPIYTKFTVKQLKEE